MHAISSELAEQLSGMPDYDFSDPTSVRAESRRMLDLAPPADTTGVEVSERQVDGLDGEPSVHIRLYQPMEQAAATPGIVQVHGGGFVMGSLDSVHRNNLRLVRELGVTLASVDYRLAPENRYPAALRDVSAVLAWMIASSGELGVDPERVAIHGVSAGSALVAAATLWARDQGLPMPCFQYLSVPVLDDRLETGSMRQFSDTPGWDSDKAAIGWRAYLGEGWAPGAATEPYAAPARATDLSGLPPTYISVMEFDPLRDEGIAFATRLLAAGVPTELHLFPGTFHGSVRFAQAAVSQREMREEVEVLRAALFAPRP
jgi:acetyl esterase/lipase